MVKVVKARNQKRMRLKKKREKEKERKSPKEKAKVKKEKERVRIANQVPINPFPKEDVINVTILNVVPRITRKTTPTEMVSNTIVVMDQVVDPSSTLLPQFFQVSAD